MTARPRKNITELYAPQFEQFDLRLTDEGPVWTGAVDNDKGSGSAWIVPVSDTCLVMDHRITPKRDMMLAEYTPEPYACVTEVSVASLECMAEIGISAQRIAQPRGPWPSGSVCTFLQADVGCELSPLKAGHTYLSRSIMFLDGYFRELEAAYPREFAGMFEDFDRSWSPEASTAMCRALRRIPFGAARQAGSHLYVRSVVEAMVAELAAARAADYEAACAQGSQAGARLAEEAAATIERLLDEGAQVGLAELANSLYVSRSKLCAVFKAETGEAVGAYARRRRIERACELLADGRLGVAQVAERLGYPQQAAFTQAFKQATGLSPTAWRASRL